MPDDEFPDFEFDNSEHTQLAEMIKFSHNSLSSSIKNHEERISDLEESEAYKRGMSKGRKSLKEWLLFFATLLFFIIMVVNILFM